MPLDGLQLGHYHLERRIGKGGMGEVYRAEDTHIGRKVAIKVIEIEDDSASSEGDILLFRRELEAIGGLNHPHTLPLYDYGDAIIEHGRLRCIYMVMPLCQERDLASWRQRRQESKVFSPVDVAHFVWQASSALQDAHDHNIVHRDVKPENFLIRFNREKPDLPDLLLADFGVAKIMTTTQKSSGNLRGTPFYMAPEQWSIDPIDESQQPKIDQYSLAIMAYDLLTGKLPFEGDFPHLMHMHTNTLPLPPSTVNTNISRTIDTVILRALEKRPEDRYPSIIEFAEAFQKAVRSGEKGEDVYMILTISETEALVGAECSFTLPGEQELAVVIPAGTKDGEMILALEGKGKTAPYGGPSGMLYVTVSTRPDPSTEALISRQLHTLEQELGLLKTANSTDMRNINFHLQNVLNDTKLLKTNNPLKIDKSNLIRIISAISAIFLAIMIIFGSCLYFLMTSSQRAMVITTLQGIATTTAQAQATATAQAQAAATATAHVTATAQAHASATAQVTATAQAHASATAQVTATAQAQTATATAQATPTPTP